ncbi:MAG TPA: RIP metalloprotease RseP [Gammaproteobacteria bacterium]|jgi:regulator of sigma E protease|nr:RIP metalloprotease RseP [Gammaproteobacteria bacterium]HAS49328.1 RIP metalloprotease RseP [Gammaproteobacteria bacterium]
MLDVLISIIALLVTLGILVTIHEFGHFWVARRCGVKVLRFSIGFGKAAKTWIGKDGVEYVIAPIPLGGYVKMLGQEDTTVTDTSSVPASQRQYSFACKPLWQRMVIVAAGPIANFLLAIFVFWLINISYGVSGIAPVVNSVIEDSVADRAGLRAGDEILAVDGTETIIWQQVTLQLLARLGETGDVTLTVDPADSNRPRDIRLPIDAWMGSETAPNPVNDLGIIQFEIPADIAGIVPGGAADAAGLQAGDKIVSVDGSPIRGWTHWVEVIRANPELTLNVVVKRGGIDNVLLMQPARATLDDGTVIGSIGAYVEETTLAELLPPEMQRQVDYNVVSAIQPALVETWDKSLFVLDSVKKMVIGLISVKNINGPITIAQVAGETATYGLDVYLGFLALLSISLGVLNLLPIPVLDGGHLLYYAIEAVIRRPVPERIQAFGLQLGLLLISGIMVLAIYNDVNRLL